MKNVNAGSFVITASFFLSVSAEILVAQEDLSASAYPTRDDWSESTGAINISSFTFQDRNRNGEYDLGDRAFAGIFVALGSNESPVSSARSNRNGFANFEASSSEVDAPLSTAGDYTFVIIPPPGWYVTTQNASQDRELVDKPGSIGGLGLTEMTRPVGLAPYTYIRGTVSDLTDETVSLLAENDVIASAEIQEDGQFLVPADPGEYILRFGQDERVVSVDQFPVDVGTLLASEPTSAVVSTIDFDELAASGLQKIPNGYGGLNWFNLNALDASFTSSSVGYQNGATSGEIVVYTSSGHPTEISRDGKFDFHSLMLTLAWPDAEGETAIFEFYRDGVLVQTDMIGVYTYGPIEYAPMITNIDRVVIRSEHYWQLVLDDLTVSFPQD